MVQETRTGLAGQFGFATESDVALNTIVTPDTFLEIVSSSGADDTTVLRSAAIGPSIVLGTGRRRELFHGSTKDLTFEFHNKGFAKLLYHCYGGYSISWPGSTDADGTLTFGGAVPTAGDTVTVGTQTYEFVATLATANDVLIGSTVDDCLANLAAAINRGFLANGQGPGDVYHAETTRNVDVDAVANGDTTMDVADKQARGDAVNSGGSEEVATTETLTDVSNVWGSATLTGGVDGTDTERVHRIVLDWERFLDLAMTAQIVIPPSEAARQAFTYSGGKVTQTALSVATGGLLQIVPSVHFRGRSLTEPIATASFAGGATFYDFTEVVVAIDDVATSVTGFSLTTPMELATDRMELGSAAPRNQIGAIARPEIVGTLNREFENIDLYSAWLNGLTAKIVATATGDTIPGSSNPYKTVITLAEVAYTGETPNLSGQGIQEQNVPFEVLDDQTNPPVVIEYHSDELWAA